MKIKIEVFEDKTALIFSNNVSLLWFFAEEIKPKLTIAQFREIWRTEEKRDGKSWMIFKTTDFEAVIRPIIQQ
jgi:hypothetical protein